MCKGHIGALSGWKETTSAHRIPRNIFPRHSASEQPGKVEVPRGHAEWPQSMLFTICSPIAIMTPGRCPSFQQRRLIHLRSPRDKNMIHLLILIFIFLPKCGAGFRSIWPASLAAPSAPCRLARDGTSTVLGMNADMTKTLWKRRGWTSSPSPLLPTGKHLISQWEEIHRAVFKILTLAQSRTASLDFTFV